MFPGLMNIEQLPLCLQAISQVSKVKMELEMMRGSGFLRSLQSTSELEHLPVNALKQIQTQLRIDSDTVEKVNYYI